MTTLTSNSYGKDLVRVLRITRNGPVHEVKDVAVRVLLEGSKVESSYYEGDNTWVVPTDTIKNTVHVMAKKHPFRDIEVFGVTLARHFLNEYAHYTKAEITISERPWQRMVIEGKPHDHSFLPSCGEERTAVVRLARESLDAPQVTSGMRNLLVMKTTGSGFVGFPRDKYTTLKEATDRIFKTTITVEWDYVCPRKPVDYTATYETARSAILHVFATTYSKAVQQTLFDMGSAIIAKCDAVKSTHFVLPNQHNWTVDLTPFGLDNQNEVFVPQADPQGYITGTVTRDACLDKNKKKAAL